MVKKLKSIYTLRLLEDNIGLTIEPVNKVGNHPDFNFICENHKSFLVSKLGPFPALEGARMLYLKERSLDVSFYLHPALAPFGTCRIKNNNDAIVFRLVEDNRFEIFISNDNRGFTPSIIQMLKDGSLDSEIAEMMSSNFRTIYIN